MEKYRSYNTQDKSILNKLKRETQPKFEQNKLISPTYNIEKYCSQEVECHNKMEGDIRY